jgi:S1-C subfamily serine protease
MAANRSFGMAHLPSDYTLRVQAGPHPNTSFPLGESLITLGRYTDNDIVIDDSRVSRHHAQIVWRQFGFEIEDLGSGNGTWVNGQRIIKATLLKPGDVIGLSPQVMLVYEVTGVAGDATQLLGLPSDTKPVAPEPKASGRGLLMFGVGGLVAAGVLVLLLGGGILLCLLASGSDEDKATPTQMVVEVNESGLIPDTPMVVTDETPAAALTITPTRETTPVPRFELARRATVFVVAFFEDVEGPVSTGSGSIVDPRGYILTNFHVVKDTRLQFVGLNSPNEDTPPEDFYLVEVIDYDANLDLALLQIVGDVDGNPLDGTLILPMLEIGDSDEVGLGDSVTILGFPSLGQETLTLTRGTVSGFIDDTDLDIHRGWIKTDTAISSGNSGGVAIDEEGRLIGVPTRVDYFVEGVGEIGLLRPINLAEDLLESIP